MADEERESPGNQRSGVSELQPESSAAITNVVNPTQELTTVPTSSSSSSSSRFQLPSELFELQPEDEEEATDVQKVADVKGKGKLIASDSESDLNATWDELMALSNRRSSSIPRITEYTQDDAGCSYPVDDSNARYFYVEEPPEDVNPSNQSAVGVSGVSELQPESGPTIVYLVDSPPESLSGSNPPECSTAIAYVVNSPPESVSGSDSPESSTAIANVVDSPPESPSTSNPPESSTAIAYVVNSRPESLSGSDPPESSTAIANVVEPTPESPSTSNRPLPTTSTFPSFHVTLGSELFELKPKDESYYAELSSTTSSSSNPEIEEESDRVSENKKSILGKIQEKIQAGKRRIFGNRAENREEQEGLLLEKMKKRVKQLSEEFNAAGSKAWQKLKQKLSRE
ncbi:hypothetical protein Ancab_037184 [Ancistrocladus abbreviatus]